MHETLVIGVGNPDRQDDGVAWHILHALADQMSLPNSESYEEPFPPNLKLDLDFYLQLTPELAEQIAPYRRVCFVDAHTGNVPTVVQIVPVTAGFQRSPFTHHLTPQSLLGMCQTVYSKTPQASLLSVRGYRFEFERQLSPETATLLPQALELLEDWLGIM